MLAKQTACTCDDFTTALRTAFLDHIGDEFFLASRGGDPRPGTFHTIVYGPKIAFCPFCGTSLTARTR